MLSWSRYGVCVLSICWRPGDIRLANIRNPILDPLSPEAATISTTVWFAVGILNNPLVLGLGLHSRPHTSCKCPQRLSRPIVQLIMPQGPTLGPTGRNAPLMLSYVITTGKTLIRGLRPRNGRELSGHAVMMLAPPFASIFSKTLGGSLLADAPGPRQDMY
ncbi:hypothetical protein EDB85DRAFT_2018056 [Lactarius pseudohatsudake]|nr:hypothetical protein EDB85DRAFT_2018056 [Lactarius pseudohatsudake]